MADNSITATAYHEAGHAIAHILTGNQFDYASIIETDDYLGVVVWSKYMASYLNLNLGSRSREIQQLSKEAIICFYAGVLAEEVATGHYNEDGADHDMDEIWRIAIHRSRNPEAFIRKLRRETRKLVRNPVNWRYISILADALLERQTLSWEEAHSLLGIED